MKRILLLAIFGLASVPVWATTVSGTFKYNGTPFTGYLTFQLSYPGTTGTYTNLPIATSQVVVSNGTFTPILLDGNDTMLPRKSYYAVNLFDNYGAWVARLNYFVTGTTFDLGQAVPTPVLTNNVNFLDLLGLRNLSVANLTISNSLQFGTGLILQSSGVTNAENIMGIFYSEAYAIQNPGSATCGINEALTALPSTGGIIILQSGNCNISSVVNVTKSNVVLQGQKSTTLTCSLSTACLQVVPSGSNSVSGVTFSRITVTSPSSISGNVLIGNGVSSTAHVSGVTFSEFHGDTSAGTGLEIDGNVDSTIVYNSSFNSNQIGIRINAISPYSIPHITLGPALYLANNSVDGLVISGGTVGTVSAQDIHVTGSGTYGVQITGASASHFLASQSEFSSSGTTNVYIQAGSGHSFIDSTFASSGFGIDLQSLGLANNQTLSVTGSRFVSNTSGDLRTAVGLGEYVYWGPQVSQVVTIIQGTPNTVFFPTLHN